MRREGPPHAAETASLAPYRPEDDEYVFLEDWQKPPELTLEDRVAVALARRGPRTIRGFITVANCRDDPDSLYDEKWVANLERFADEIER